MTTPRVFAVHQPTGRDIDTGEVYPTMDLSPASEFGELRFILRHNQNPFDDLDQTLLRVRQRLISSNFGPGDYLLLVGNPILIGLISAVAVELTGHLRVLQWNRSRGCYLPAHVTFVAQSTPLAAPSDAA